MCGLQVHYDKHVNQGVNQENTVPNRNYNGSTIVIPPTKTPQVYKKYRL